MRRTDLCERDRIHGRKFLNRERRTRTAYWRRRDAYEYLRPDYRGRIAPRSIAAGTYRRHGDEIGILCRPNPASWAGRRH